MSKRVTYRGFLIAFCDDERAMCDHKYDPEVLAVLDFFNWLNFSPYADVVTVTCNTGGIRLTANPATFPDIEADYPWILFYGEPCEPSDITKYAN
jgi:hypothetical protein